MQKEAYLWFIDYAKTYEKVRYKDLMELLTNLDILQRDIRIIKKQYCQQTACIRIDNEFSGYTKIKEA